MSGGGVCSCSRRGNEEVGQAEAGVLVSVEVRSKTSMWSELDLIWMWFHVCMA